MTAWRRRVLGNEWVGRAYANKTAFNKEFQEPITRYAWNWTRAHYDERTRRVLMIGTGPAGRIPCARARGHQGIRLHEVNIKEIILQQAICRGVPAANHAFKEAAEVIAGSQDPNNRVQRKDQNQGTLRSAAASSCGGSDSFSSAGRL